MRVYTEKAESSFRGLSEQQTQKVRTCPWQEARPAMWRCNSFHRYSPELCTSQGFTQMQSDLVTYTYLLPLRALVLPAVGVLHIHKYPLARDNTCSVPVLISLHVLNATISNGSEWVGFPRSAFQLPEMLDKRSVANSEGFNSLPVKQVHVHSFCFPRMLHVALPTTPVTHQVPDRREAALNLFLRS